MSIYARDVVIEITRRCNMSCPHCLRGDAQALDMPYEYIDKLFSQLDSIDTLTTGGGEPSLKPEILHYIIDSAKKHNVEIYNFYMVTNALVVPEEFLTAVIKWYAYCSSNEISALSISRDQFHKEVPAENIDMLHAFSFTDERGEIPGGSIIYQGRAAEEGLGVRDIECDLMTVVKEDDDIQIDEGMLYMNVKGNIIMGCDFSYERQADEDVQLCHVDKLTETLEDMAHEHLE